MLPVKGEGGEKQKQRLQPIPERNGRSLFLKKHKGGKEEMFISNKNYLWKLLIATMLVLSIVLSACSPTSEPETVDETVEVEATTEVSVDPTACNLEAPESPSTINTIAWAGLVTHFYADEFAKCEDVENLEVNSQILDFVSVTEQVRLALSGGGESPYQIVHASNTELVEWGSAGWLLPLNDLIDKYGEEYDLDDHSPKAWEGATIDGQVYGIPFMSNTLHLYYRSDLFEKYDLEPPTTYDEVIAACEVLKDEPSITLPFTMQVHAGWAWEFRFFSFLRSYGGDYLNDDNTPAFNGPEGVTAATQIKEVIDACMGPEGLTYSIEDSANGLATGTLAFIHTWGSQSTIFDDPETSDVVGLVESAPAAAPNPGGLLGGSAWHDYWTIPVTSEVDPDLVFRVIMEATDRQSQEEGAEIQSMTRLSVPQGVPNAAAANETIANGVGIYDPNPAVALAQSALWNWLPFIGTGEMTPQEALDAAAEEYITEATAQGFLP
ncbi:ABC transporter substrate-binding protein [Candidatus Leptofilum sp.]|uniref:ABC transporter substrate-binding protein n=1 Tax=Candidatus Leptofilum sp. TaxID=3241576 RepID=UPI003B5A8564